MAVETRTYPTATRFLFSSICLDLFMPGRIHWRQVDGPDLEVQALELRGGWLVCRQADGLLLGIIWSDGNYYADLLENRKGQPVKRLTRRPGLKVRGTLHMDPDNPDDLGALVGG